jgi:hypothetical protein
MGLDVCAVWAHRSSGGDRCGRSIGVHLQGFVIFLDKSLETLRDSIWMVHQLWQRVPLSDPFLCMCPDVFRTCKAIFSVNLACQITCEEGFMVQCGLCYNRSDVFQPCAGHFPSRGSTLQSLAQTGYIVAPSLPPVVSFPTVSVSCGQLWGKNTK